MFQRFQWFLKPGNPMIKWGLFTFIIGLLPLVGKASSIYVSQESNFIPSFLAGILASGDLFIAIVPIVATALGELMEVNKRLYLFCVFVFTAGFLIIYVSLELYATIKLGNALQKEALNQISIALFVATFFIGIAATGLVGLSQWLEQAEV